MWKSVINLFWIIIIFVITPFNSVCQFLDSKGKIFNSGTIVIKGNANISQDTLLGKVIYNLDKTGYNQYIPNRIYNDVQFKGISQKIFNDTLKQFVSLFSFYSDSITVLRLLPNHILNIFAKINHNGTINPAYQFGKIELNGSNNQEIQGKGVYKELTLNNESGARVIEKGGFEVDNKLELLNGVLYNDSINNFIIGNDIEITRTTYSTLSYYPLALGEISIKYIGDSEIYSSYEIPFSNNIKNLEVSNTGGLKLNSDLIVNGRLICNNNIYTEYDSTNKYILTLNSDNNPIFINQNFEIIGTVKRMKLNKDKKYIFNNSYTYLETTDDDFVNNLSEITFRVLPKHLSDYSVNQNHIERLFEVNAKDLNGDKISYGYKYNLGLSWRASNNLNIDESSGINEDSLFLLRYVNDSWYRVIKLDQVLSDNNYNWKYTDNNISEMGLFAIGLPNNTKSIKLLSKVFLEGAYQDSKMNSNLSSSGLLPITAPNIYPYSLSDNLENRSIKTRIPFFVDWVMLGFSESITSESKYYLVCLLDENGNIVDMDGSSGLDLSNCSLNSGMYYISVYHRNHLPVITENLISIYPETSLQLIDFVNPVNVLGRTNSLSLISISNTNELLFGLVAGNTDNNMQINDKDYDNIQQNFNNEGYLIQDINFDGIINIMDFNYSWNNRLKKTAIP